MTVGCCEKSRSEFDAENSEGSEQKSRSGQDIADSERSPRGSLSVISICIIVSLLLGFLSGEIVRGNIGMRVAITIANAAVLGDVTIARDKVLAF
jgi:hypothetical protein